MPKRNTTDGLLAKFDKVVVEDTLNIKEADLAYCKRIQELYDKKVIELDNWLKQLWEVHNKNPKASFISFQNKYKKYPQVDNDYTKRGGEAKKDPFAIYSFSVLYDIEWITDKKIAAHRTLINAIVSYFNSEYNLNIEIPGDYFIDKDTRELKQKVNYRPLVKTILDKCGGVDLLDVGIERMKEAFRKSVTYQNRIKLSKGKLTLSDFFYFQESWSSIMKWEYRSDKLSIVTEALSYFEFNELGNRCPELAQLVNTEVNFRNPYKLFSLSKVESMKVFKNGRADFKFRDAETAQEFYNLFELHKLPESRW